MKLDWLFFPLIMFIAATCTVKVEQEETKRDEICKEFLLKCTEIKKKCEC